MSQEYNAYAEKLMTYMKVNIFMLFVIIGIVIIFSIILLKLFKEQKILLYMIAVGVVLCTLVYFTSVYPYQYDINNNSYVEYTGNFFVEQGNYSGSSGGPSYILIRIGDKAKSVRYISAINDINIEDNTQYNGKIVWSEKSKVLLDINVTQ